MSPENITLMKGEIVEKLITASRFEDAGDLLDPQSNFTQVLECYLKSNNYQKAISICS